MISPGPVPPRRRPPVSGPLGRWPAVPVAIAVAGGIVFDRHWAVPLAAWLPAGAVFALAGVLLGLGRRPRVASLGLLLACACLGGAWHHRVWWTAAADDISFSATDRPRLVRLTGVLDEQPWILPKRESVGITAYQPVDRTIATLRCQLLVTNTGPLVVSGRARLSVNGHLLGLNAGDTVEVVGTLTRPAQPRNSGEFDYADWLRGTGIRAVIETDHPAAVRRISVGSSALVAARSRFREACQSQLKQHLSDRTRTVGEALLIGGRSRLDEDLRTAFIETGTMHLLAISGLHVWILVGFLWCFCRLANLGPGSTYGLILACVVAYAYVTELRPPVVRASVLVFVLLAGWGRHRPASAMNSLAVSGLVVLALNPTDLFNIGAQLSFLAVVAILWAARLSRPSADVPIDRSPLAQGILQYGWQAAVTTATISLLTAPLIAFEFHVVSLIGLVLNLLLVPLVSGVVWIGYLFLLTACLLPGLTSIAGIVFEYGLRLVLFLVEQAAAVELGHRYVAGPAGWWLLGFYILTAAVIASRPRPLVRFWAWRGLLAWTVLGLAVPLLKSPPPTLRCTFLALGHGGGVLLELPNGRTLLYDAGSINNPGRAQQTISTTLWERGRTGLDAVILSHADVDHYNAAPGLLRNVPVGHLLIARSFLDFEQAGVVQVVETASDKQVPIRLFSAGDELRMDPQTILRVLHPRDGPAGGHDNSHSLVLLAEFAGRRILLTGDLERDGLAELLRTEPIPCDVILSPHHGGRDGNTPELADWTRPKTIIVSAARSDMRARLEGVYGPEARVLPTAEFGAVTIEIDARGTLRCEPFITAQPL